jgi:integrase
MAGAGTEEIEREGQVSIYKRGSKGIYWYRFQFNGRTIRESTKQRNDKVARSMESAHRTSLAKGEVGIREKQTAPTLKEFCTGRIEPYAKALSPIKWIWYRAGIRALLKYATLANTPLDEIKSEVGAGFAAWRTSQEITPSSINSNLRVLRRILRLAAEWGVIEVAPKIQLLTGEARRERVITPNEETAYLAKCSEFLKEVFTVLIDTGMRPDELHRMQWQEISWPTAVKRGTILVIKGKSQAARRRIRMTPRVHATLTARWEAQGKPAIGWVWPAPTKSGHINHSTTKKQHKAALTDSKVEPFVLYSLRHTFLTRLGASGCDVWTLMRIAGHSSIQMSARYVHPADDTLDRAYAALTGEPPQAIAIAGRHKNGHNRKSGALKPERKIARKVRQYSGIMVSADGLEPSTHALKGHCSTN